MGLSMLEGPSQHVRLLFALVGWGAALTGAGCGGRACEPDDDRTPGVERGPLRLRVSATNAEAAAAPMLEASCRAGDPPRTPITGPDRLWVRVEVENLDDRPVDIRSLRVVLRTPGESPASPLPRDRLLSELAERCPAWSPSETPVPHIDFVPPDGWIYPKTRASGWLVFPRPATNDATLTFYELPADKTSAEIPLPVRDE
jgi:hypothetical protein